MSCKDYTAQDRDHLIALLKDVVIGMSDKPFLSQADIADQGELCEYLVDTIAERKQNPAGRVVPGSHRRRPAQRNQGIRP